MKLILLATVVIVLLLSFSMSAPTNSTELAQELVRIYGQPTIDREASCSQHTDCTSCTSDYWCVWLLKENSGISVSRVDGNVTLFNVKGFNFCWSGTAIGAANRNLNPKDLTGGVTNLVVTSGYNDYQWKQCSVKSGATLVAAIVAPIVSIFLLCLLCCTIYCCCCRHRAPKENYDEYIPLDPKKR